MGLMVRELARAWKLLDINRLTETLDPYLTAVRGVVEKYGPISGGMAADYYDALRASAGIRGKFTVKPSSLPEPGQIDESLKWATRQFWTAIPEAEAEAVRDVLREADVEDFVPTFTEDDIQTMVEGAVDKLVGDVGRNTLIESIQRDKQAKGWARVPEPDCCYFCALLSTRGAVYHSRESASFEAHDHCRCQPEPLFGKHYEPTAKVREWQRMYEDVTGSISGKDKITEFRRAYEGRADGPRRKSVRQSGKSPKQHVVGSAALTPDVLRTQLSALEKSSKTLEESGSNPTALQWQKTRIAQLRRMLND